MFSFKIKRQAKTVFPSVVEKIVVQQFVFFENFEMYGNFDRCMLQYGHALYVLMPKLSILHRRVHVMYCICLLNYKSVSFISYIRLFPSPTLYLARHYSQFCSYVFVFFICLQKKKKIKKNKRMTLRFRMRRHLCLLGETLMLIYDKDYFVMVLIYYTKSFVYNNTLDSY